MLKIQREMKHGLCSKDIARQTLKQTIMLQCDKYSLEWLQEFLLSLAGVGVTRGCLEKVTSVLILGRWLRAP
jgi:hypothetical protein